MLVCSHACIPQRNVVAYGIIHCRIWNFEDKAHQRRYRKVMRHDSFFETFIDNGSQCLERFQGAKDVIMQSRDTIYYVLSIMPALFVLCIIWCFIALVYHTSALISIVLSCGLWVWLWFWKRTLVAYDMIHFRIWRGRRSSLDVVYSSFNYDDVYLKSKVQVLTFQTKRRCSTLHIRNYRFWTVESMSRRTTLRYVIGCQFGRRLFIILLRWRLPWVWTF